jgi:hypothetical protein
MVTESLPCPRSSEPCSNVFRHGLGFKIRGLDTVEVLRWSLSILLALRFMKFAISPPMKSLNFATPRFSPHGTESASRMSVRSVAFPPHVFMYRVYRQLGSYHLLQVKPSTAISSFELVFLSVSSPKSYLLPSAKGRDALDALVYQMQYIFEISPFFSTVGLRSSRLHETRSIETSLPFILIAHHG